MKEAEMRAELREVLAVMESLVNPVSVAHGIDQTKTVEHDYDRLGTAWSAWCICGWQIANRAWEWKERSWLDLSSVEGRLKDHVRDVNLRMEQDSRTHALLNMPKLVTALRGVVDWCERMGPDAGNDFYFTGTGQVIGIMRAAIFGHSSNNPPRDVGESPSIVGTIP